MPTKFALLLLVNSVLLQSAAESASFQELKIHPKVFALIDAWPSDSVAPVVSEVNLDAVAANGNQFNFDEVKIEDGWFRWNDPDTHGFLRYRLIEEHGSHYKVEFQSNGGGTFTSQASIGVAIVKRDMNIDGQRRSVRVLRVESYSGK